MPAPPLLEAVNRNALAVFLLVRLRLLFSLFLSPTHPSLFSPRQANVATGVVNLSMWTMYTPDGWAIGVLAAYAFGVCVFAWAVRGRRVWNL
jgi:phosphatidylinositol glycan class W